MCEADSLEYSRKVLHLLSKLPNFLCLVAVALWFGSDAFCCTGGPWSAVGFLLVFCHSCKPRRNEVLPRSVCRPDGRIVK